MINLSATELRASNGNAFDALLAKCSHLQNEARERLCSGEGCSFKGRFNRQPWTSVDQHGSPDLIMLDLPDDPPRNLQYSLRPHDTRQLVVSGTTVGNYRLASMILYSKGYHYIADCCDPRDGCWLRIDSNGSRGIGQVSEPATGRIMHQGKSYYPVLAAYARVLSAYTQLVHNF